jgi:1,4-alpha-glucan branching enzyme
MISDPPNPRPAGQLALILHAHLPFVRHPEHEQFLEEHWLFEAITETYIPLLRMLERLVHDGVPFRLTISVTPTLAAMLDDDLLRDRYAHRIHRLVELAGREIERTRSQPPFDRLARMYYARFMECERAFNAWYERDLLGALRVFRDLGVVELMGSAATHGYLPLLLPNRDAVRAQIEVGVAEHRRRFGTAPAGFWLPECAYAPGIDELLADAGVRYTVLEAHGLLYGSPPPRFGLAAPAYCPSGLAVFGRDIESARQVWSATEGYPGDRAYREFYRDAGHDFDRAYIGPYVLPDGLRVDTGLKYYRITGAGRDKEPYDAVAAHERACGHAEHFIEQRVTQTRRLGRGMGRPPLIVAPYDAELFGHWWYEGPDWVEAVLRRAAADGRLRTVTPSEALDEQPANQLTRPCESSWGWKGYHEVWLGGANDWLWRELHAAAGRMIGLARRIGEPDELARRALNQAARELLLAQASDWPFIMSTGTAVDYAVRRAREHLDRFRRLADAAESDAVDVAQLTDIEHRDTVFPEIDYRIFARP